MYRLIRITVYFAYCIVLGGLPAYTQDITNLGGDLTTTIPGANALQVNAPNVIDPVRRQQQLDGFEPFHQIFTKQEGLGPNFVHVSCGKCHVQNGRGRVKIVDKRRRREAMVIKVSLQGLDDTGAPINIPTLGIDQLQPSRLNGKRRFRTRLRWSKVPGSYPDGTKYKLRAPRLRFRIRGVKRKAVASSLRATPPLVGLGLLEAIKESDILALSDENDSNNDGISGRPQYVPDPETGDFELGRFGFRASTPSVKAQTAAAAFFDMGVTSSLFNPSGGAVEMSDETLDLLTIYQQLPGVPIARNQDDPEVQNGKALFQSIGCDDCHVMQFTTESSVYPELDGQTIHPFTDLLLHDMGPELADNRPEFQASGSEWRTTPLWGIGFTAELSKNPDYLHDGRARTIEEAILWHGGEAEATQQAFKALSKADRDAVIAFLRSI